MGILTEVALSKTEAELISMSEGLRMVIPLLSLTEEMGEQRVGRFGSKIKVHYKVFEEYMGAMTVYAKNQAKD